MSTQIQYRSGHPQKFTATKEFTLGLTGIKIPVGAEIEFDGNKVHYDGCEPFSVPTVRGAVRMKWLVPTEDYDPEDTSFEVPEQAPLKMRKAQGGDPMKPREEVESVTVAAEEREVGTVAARNKFAEERNAIRGRRVVVAEEQEGVVVRSKLKTPAHQRTDLSKVSVQSAIQSADNLEFEAEEPRIIRKIRPSSDQETEGVRIKNSVAAGTSVAIPESYGEATQSVVESEGMRFIRTNGPKKDQHPLLVPEAADAEASDSACRTIAKSICSDFPENYVFTDSPRKKMARIAADYDDRPDVIRAVAAAETDPNVKAQLVAEYPEAFSL